MDWATFLSQEPGSLWKPQIDWCKWSYFEPWNVDTVGCPKRLCDLHKVRTVQQSKRSASLSPRCQMQLWNSLHYRPQPMCQEMSLRLSDPLPAFREDLEMRRMMEWTLAPGFHDLPVYSSLSMRREGLCCWSLSYGTHYYSSGTLHGFYSPFEQGGNSTKTYPCQNYETHHVVNSSTPHVVPGFLLTFEWE